MKAKRQLSEAELNQRREAGKRGGRKPGPARYDLDRARRIQARRRIRTARYLLRLSAPEAAETLIAAMRGQLDGSDAVSMARASDAILRKVGIGDLLVTKEIGKAANPIGLLIPGAANYPDAAKPEAADAGDQPAEPTLEN